MSNGSFRPWVGNHYDETRLLLLGESAYSWRDENNELQHPTLDHPTIMVNEVLNDFRNAADMRFIRMLSQGLAGDREPSRERLHHVWHRVAFTDYVGGTVGEGPGEHPTPDMWEAAGHAFRPDILNSLRPRRIIVIGKTMWSQMPKGDVHLTDDMQGYFLDDHSVAMCWALHHTSAGVGWTRLADTIHFALGRELPRSGPHRRFPGDGE